MPMVEPVVIDPILECTKCRASVLSSLRVLAPSRNALVTISVLAPSSDARSP